MGKYKKLLIFLVIIGLVLLLDRHYGWSKYLSNKENLLHLHDMVELHFWKVALIYIGLTIVGCVVLALPGITFAILAGMIFGPWLGSLLCIIATTLGASASFLVGRFFLKDAVKPMVEKNKTLKRILFDQVDNSDIILLLITRILPIFPYNLQNFAYGITDIKFWRYTLYSFCFMIPGVMFITIGGAGITAQTNRGLYFAIAGVMAVAITIFGLFLKRKYIDNKADGTNSDSDSQETA